MSSWATISVLVRAGTVAMSATQIQDESVAPVALHGSTFRLHSTTSLVQSTEAHLKRQDLADKAVAGTLTSDMVVPVQSPGGETYPLNAPILIDNKAGEELRNDRAAARVAAATLPPPPPKDSGTAIIGSDLDPHVHRMRLMQEGRNTGPLSWDLMGGATLLRYGAMDGDLRSSGRRAVGGVGGLGGLVLTFAFANPIWVCRLGYEGCFGSSEPKDGVMASVEGNGWPLLFGYRFDRGGWARCFIMGGYLADFERLTFAEYPAPVDGKGKHYDHVYSGASRRADLLALEATAELAMFAVTVGYLYEPVGSRWSGSIYPQSSRTRLSGPTFSAGVSFR